MTEHDLYNDENLDRVFAKLDVNSDGTLCQREVASLLGDDHAFTRELLQTVQQVPRRRLRWPHRGGLGSWCMRTHASRTCGCLLCCFRRHTPPSSYHVRSAGVGWGVAEA
jgi:hypothetical protein